MAEKPAGTPEAIAFELLHAIARQEGKTDGATIAADKEWILSTYTDCLDIAKGMPYPPRG